MTARMVQSTIELVVHVTVSHPEGSPAPDELKLEVQPSEGCEGTSVDEVTIVESSVVAEGVSLG